MAICKRCGAYLPDGHTTCLACGFNESAQTQQNVAEEKQPPDGEYSYRGDVLKYREQLDENRRRQQEQSRRWAEQEQQRRRRQQEARSWAEKEYERQKQQRKAAAPETEPNEKLWSMLSYVSVLWLVPYLTGKGGSSAKFHAKQGLRLMILGAVADALHGVPIVGGLLNIARVLLMIKGIGNAANGICAPLPYIGELGPK